jgi:hypothetical protein
LGMTTVVSGVVGKVATGFHPVGKRRPVSQAILVTSTATRMS